MNSKMYSTIDTHSLITYLFDSKQVSVIMAAHATNTGTSVFSHQAQSSQSAQQNPVQPGSTMSPVQPPSTIIGAQGASAMPSDHTPSTSIAHHASVTTGASANSITSRTYYTS